MNQEELKDFDDLVKATITELANMITAQAVTKLHDLGFRFDLTPPAIFTGENMEVSNSDVEALIVPMRDAPGQDRDQCRHPREGVDLELMRFGSELDIGVLRLV